MSNNTSKRQSLRLTAIPQSPDDEEHINDYDGWKVPFNNYRIPTISLDGLSPQQFFDEYVAARRPVVLKGPLPDVQVPIQKWKSYDYLRQKAGDEKIKVEQRASVNDSYGQGNEVSMTLADFLDLLAKGNDDKHYLTTQDVQANEDGRPDLMAPLMKRLNQDFPLRPKLMETLVPQNINLWMGGNSAGTTSGLHHDFHDNLYLVLRGTKQFLLFSPADALKMQTRGKIDKVHRNGLINYQGAPTTAYGADLKANDAAMAARARELAEKRLVRAEEALKQGIEGAEEELQAAEADLEAAMEALLDAEMEDGNDDDHGDNIDDDASVATDQEEKEASIGNDAVNHNDSCDEQDGRRLVDKTIKNPNNFSTASPNGDIDSASDGKRYEQMNANQAYCEVNEGDVLYLPASWFHEVISIGATSLMKTSSSNAKSERNGAHHQGHMALNYWFHPPDTLNFDIPYSTDFWPNDFKQRFQNENDNITSQPKVIS